MLLLNRFLGCANGNKRPDTTIGGKLQKGGPRWIEAGDDQFFPSYCPWSYAFGYWVVSADFRPLARKRNLHR